MIHTGDCLEWLASLEAKSVVHVITDPPYAVHVHSKVWQSKALSAKGDKRTSTAFSGLGFAHIDDAGRAAFAVEAARLSRRWTIAFCDVESISAWKSAFETAGLDWVRACIWDKVDSCPQFTGDRPASAAEAFCVAHARGRKKWNGGGRRNVFRHEVNGERGAKPHPSTKPLPLMIEIVDLFTDSGDLVIDPFAGSGTTGVACLRRGRRFMGCELSPEYAALARERLAAEAEGSTLQARRAGQETLFARTTTGTK